MKVQILGDLCWITVNQDEAVVLIQSLANQIVSKNPNTGRLESYCSGDVGEMSIAVNCK